MPCGHVPLLAFGAPLRGSDGERGVDHFLGEDDLVFAAEAVFGAATPEAIERLRYGSGMMVSFSKGRGEVFTAGTCEWVAGLIDRDPFVERITHNVLERLLGG